MRDVATPTLDRMLEPHRLRGDGKACTVADHSQLIGDFLDWLSEQGIHLAKWEEVDGLRRDQRLFAVGAPFESLLADYFGVDLKAMEAERRALLDAIRDGSGR